MLPLLWVDLESLLLPVCVCVCMRACVPARVVCVESAPVYVCAYVRGIHNQ